MLYQQQECQDILGFEIAFYDVFTWVRKKKDAPATKEVDNEIYTFTCAYGIQPSGWFQ